MPSPQAPPTLQPPAIPTPYNRPHSAPQRPAPTRIPMPWKALTLLGDAVLVVPLLIGLAVWLRVRPAAPRLSNTELLQWASIVAASLALVAGSKIAFYGWGTGIRRWDLTCFSGHAVLAWLLWPALFALLVPPQQRALRVTATLAGAALATFVAWSRVPIGAHPPS